MMSPSTTDATDSLAAEPSPVHGVSRNVFALSLVSLCTDVSSELMYPLVPLFLTGVLGAPATIIGLVEGLAEGTANVLKLVSGRLTDRYGRRRSWVYAGYGLSTVAKPLLAVAVGWPLVLTARLVDRVGKGVRTTPRDAIIAASSDPTARGRAFGFHRSMDTIGAVIGPLVGVAALALTHQNFRLIFLLATLPAALGVLLIGRVREPMRAPRGSATRNPGNDHFRWRSAPQPYRRFLAIGLLFALGNSSDAFLVLRAHTLGLGTIAAVLAYAVYNVVYAGLGWPAGILSDRIGRRGLLIGGYMVFALVYLGLATSSPPVWPLFALYGLYMAVTGGVSKALITDVVPSHDRGGALGLYAASTGLMALVSSVIAGLLWDRVAPAAPFFLGGLTAALAAGALIIFYPEPRQA